jgi:hypothetical protein
MTTSGAGAARFDPSSGARLTRHDLGRFTSGGLFDRIGRAVCAAGCLPRKELYESWEVARRVRRRFRGGTVLDMGGGHGLLAQIMLLLDDSSARAVVVDTALPASAAPLYDAMVGDWPRLAGRVTFVRGEAGSVEVSAGDVVVSCHACGAFADRVIDAAVGAGARLGLLPCCHDADTCDAGGLTGWMDLALAIDATRVARLRHHGYQVWTQTIPGAITPKNRLILARGRA